jgi:hypothetical protein
VSVPSTDSFSLPVADRPEILLQIMPDGAEQDKHEKNMNSIHFV